MEKKVVYIAGPITGVPNYRAAFQQAEADLETIGYIPLCSAYLPQGMTNAQYMRICLAMLDSADAVVFLPGWAASDGTLLEKDFARYTHIPRATIRTKSPFGGLPLTDDERRVWLAVELEEAFAWAPNKHKEVTEE